MKVAFFSTQSYDRQSFTACNTHYQNDLHFLERRYRIKKRIHFQELSDN